VDAIGSLDSLLLASLCAGIIGFLIAVRFLPRRTAAVVAFTKAVIPFVYFRWAFDGGWQLLDDVSYFDRGKALLTAGYDPITIWFSRAGMIRIMTLAGGHHILYEWFNLLAQRLFGPYYHSAVLLNVLLTFPTAAVLYAMVRHAGFSERYARGICVFFLLHWEVVAWSSFVNLKDTLVMSMSATMLYVLMLMSDRMRPLRVVSALLLVIAFYWIRFYVPIVMAIAYTIFQLTRGRQERKRLIWRVLIGLGLAVAAVVYIGVEAITAQMTKLVPSPLSVIEGVTRMLLSPQPWAIESHYGFLLLPSALNLIFLLPGVLGAVWLWRYARPTRLLLIYFLLVVILFAAFPEEQGPRHRVQVSFVLAWAQFHFCWIAWQRIAGRLRQARWESVPTSVVPS